MKQQFSRFMLLRLLRIVAALMLAVFPTLVHGEGGDPEWPPLIENPLTRGSFGIRLYPAPGKDPHALVIFGSGDGGWSGWEHTLCTWLQEANLAVVGFDFGTYAATDYDQPTLAKDMAATATFALRRLGLQEIPILYGGWSLGAVQAVAASDGTNRPPTLEGLLLMSLDSRGRYGIRTPDTVGITPTGPGTFDLREFNHAMKNLRVVQYHGTADFMAKTTWIRLLTSPHQLYLLRGMNHGFDGLVPEFKPVLLQGVAWALGDESAAASPEQEIELVPVELMTYGLLLILLLVVLFSSRTALFLLPIAVALCGIAHILATLFPQTPAFIAEMEEWVPLEISQHGRFLLFVSGALLFALAQGLHRRKRVAWYMASIVLTISAILNFTQTFNWNRSAVAAVMLAALIRHRKLFSARSDAPSFRAGIIIATGSLLLLTVYGMLSLHVLGARGHFGNPLSWTESLCGAILTALQLRTELDNLAGREATHLLETIRMQGLGTGFVALLMLLRPVILRRHAHSPADIGKVRRLVEAYPEDPMSVFALLPDKHYYFHPEIDGVVAYALWRNIAVVLADPISSPQYREQLVHGFIHFCRECDWRPVFYCLHHSNRDLYERAGFQLVRIAEEARQTLADFKLTGARFQNLRTARNKAVKNGFQFGWYGGKTAPDSGLEKQFENLSKEWLKQKHIGEMSFDLSSFSVTDLREKGAAYVRTTDGRLLAFATWHPYAHGQGRCLDLMRSHADEKGVMDFLLLESIETFRNQGVEEVCFGSAPLANTSDPDKHCASDRAIRFIFDNFDRFYGYKRLFFFKQKYGPRWEPRYLAYPRSTPLPLVGLAVAGVHLTHGFRSLLRS
jgi:lysylphosphatidylglycerol synthetase-like protein (DUF2156 family)